MKLLADLLADVSPDHPAWKVADIAAHKAREEGKAKFAAPPVMSETQEAPAATIAPEQPPSSDLLNVRTGMAEMRALGDGITASAPLSSGETVGEFLLRVWLGKEAARKQKAK